MNYQTTSINKKSKDGPVEQHLRNEINKSTKRSNEMLTSVTKQKQCHRTGLVWVAGPGHIF